MCKSEIKQENYNLKKSVLHPTCVAFVKIVLFSGRKRKRGSQGRERHRWLARTQGKWELVSWDAGHSAAGQGVSAGSESVAFAC